MVAKYGLPWNWKKGIQLAKQVVNLGEKLIDGFNSWFKARKSVAKAKDGLAKAQDELAAAKKKAANTRKEDSDGPGCTTKKHSFLPGTLVLLADGTSKKIEDVRPGDKITVTDPETGETTVREVANTIVTEDDKHFVDLTIEGKSGDPVTLISTTTHPFWVESEKAWIEAGDLEPGMELRTPTGDTVTLEGTRYFDQRQRTHDLTVTGIHTYYVLAGATPVLVHNCNDIDDATTLYRFGSGPETTEKLAADAANAENHDFPHGISTSTRLPPKIRESGEYRSTTVGALRERGFRVEQTGRNKAHHTVHLPKPVTDQVTDSLNELFGSPG